MKSKKRWGLKVRQNKTESNGWSSMSKNGMGTGNNEKQTIKIHK